MAPYQQLAPGHRQPVDAEIALSHGDIRVIIFGIGVALFLGALDQTIIAAALPTIAADLGQFNNISWVAGIYLLTATSVTPLYGKFSDMHGRRVSLLLAVSLFVIGSIGCAVAPSMLVLIAARAVQGLGGGGLISLAQTIIGDIVAPKERGRYQIYFASIFMVASLLGPSLGGYLTEYFSWTLIFWINVPLGLLALLVSNTALKRLPIAAERHRLDILGTLLMVGATVSLMLALHYGGEGVAWTSPTIVWLFVASVVLWALFAWRVSTADEPLIPLELFANRVMSMGTGAACFAMGTYIALSMYLPVYFQAARGLSTSDSGLALMPFMAGTVVGATIAGQLMGRIVHYKRVPVIGLLAAMACALGLVFFAERLSLTAFELVLTAISIGLGTVLPTTTVAIQNAVKRNQLGVATGTMGFFRQLGSAVLVAVYGVILLGGATAGGAATLMEHVAARSFELMFMATFAGFAIAFVFLVLMTEQPLRSGVKDAASAVIAD